MQSITEKIIEQLVYPNWIPNHPDHPPFTIQQKYDLYRYIGDLDKEDEWWVYWYMGESDTMNYFEDEWDQILDDNEFKEHCIDDGSYLIDYELLEFNWGFKMINYYIFESYEDEWDQLVDENKDNDFEWKWGWEWDEIDYKSELSEDELRYQYDEDFHEDEINFE